MLIPGDKVEGTIVIGNNINIVSLDAKDNQIRTGIGALMKREVNQ